MAEGFLKKLLSGRKKEFNIGSAGIFAMDGYPPTEETVRAMEDDGVDVSGHLSRRLTPEMVRTADKIYVMELLHRAAILNAWPESSEKVFLITEFSSDSRKKKEDINIPDPIRQSDGFYKEVREVIQDCVKNIVKSLEGSK